MGNKVFPLGATEQQSDTGEQAAYFSRDSSTEIESSTVSLKVSQHFNIGLPKLSAVLGLKERRKARYDSKGFRALWELLQLYVAMLYPVVIVTSWMFGMFAFTSYMVPKVFCKSTVISQQGTSQGFRPCVYNAGGDYTDYRKNTAVKVLWLLFWVIQQAWLVGFSAVMGQAMFGRYISWKHWSVIGSVTALTALFMAIRAPAYHTNLNETIYFALPVVTALFVAASVAHACALYTRDKLNFLRYLLLMLVAGGAVTIYFIVIPRIVTARATSQQLLLVRLIVHPLVWGLMTMMFTHTARHIGEVANMMQASLYIWPYMYNSLYGRFLLLQLGGTGNVLILNFLISLFGIVSRLSSRSTLSSLLTLMYRSRTAEALHTASAMTQIRMAETFAHIISEHAGIICAAAIFSFGSVTSVNGVKPDIFDIWTKAAVQSATALAVDYVVMAIDWKFQSIDYFSHWVKDMRKFIFFLLIVVTFGGIRLCMELLLLFCPSYTEETGVLLEYCDVPSLFAGIGS